MSGRGGSGRGSFLRSLQGSTDEDSRDTDSQTRPSALDSGLGLPGAKGRGRFLLERTDDSDNLPTSSNAPSQDGSSLTRATSAIEACFLPKFAPGRGKFFPTSSSHDESTSSHGTSGIEVSFLPKPIGRGKIVQLLQEEKLKSLASDVDFEETVESVTKEVEEMHVEVVETEQEPVIRRGTKGLCICFQ